MSNNTPAGPEYRVLYTRTTPGEIAAMPATLDDDKFYAAVTRPDGLFQPTTWGTAFVHDQDQDTDIAPHAREYVPMSEWALGHPPTRLLYEVAARITERCMKDETKGAVYIDKHGDRLPGGAEDWDQVSAFATVADLGEQTYMTPKPGLKVPRQIAIGGIYDDSMERFGRKAVGAARRTPIRCIDIGATVLGIVPDAIVAREHFTQPRVDSDFNSHLVEKAGEVLQYLVSVDG